MKFLRDIIEQKSAEASRPAEPVRPEATAAPAQPGPRAAEPGQRPVSRPAGPGAAIAPRKVAKPADVGALWDDDADDADDDFDNLMADAFDKQDGAAAPAAPVRQKPVTRPLPGPMTGAASPRPATGAPAQPAATVRPAAQAAPSETPRGPSMSSVKAAYGQDPAAARPRTGHPGERPQASSPVPPLRKAPADEAAPRMPRPMSEAGMRPSPDAQSLRVKSPAPAREDALRLDPAQRAERLQPQAHPEAQPQAQAPGRVQPQAPVQTPSDAIEVPSPAAGRNKSRAGRAKTRLLGFNSGMGAGSNPFDQTVNGSSEGYTEFPVGWLVVTDGPGRGAAFTLFSGVAQIGRGEGQTVRLDFGDNSISRENHAAIAYDAETNSFFLGHGGKANLVRCNNMPVLSTQALSAGDSIRIGETTLKFVPLCGAGFQWQASASDGTHNAARG